MTESGRFTVIRINDLVVFQEQHVVIITAMFVLSIAANASTRGRVSCLFCARSTLVNTHYAPKTNADIPGMQNLTAFLALICVFCSVEYFLVINIGYDVARRHAALHSDSFFMQGSTRNFFGKDCLQN